jgi:beta-lactamase regulating signal transducer with metallopeptidase domain
MSYHLLLEAAVRSLVMGAIIFLAMRLLGIEQVRVRRAAWLLALAGALLMPVLVGSHIGPKLLPEIGMSSAPPAVGPLEVRASRVPAAASVPPPFSVETAAATDTGSVDAGTLIVAGYCIVAAVLSLRLCVGAGLALRLRNQAERIGCRFDPRLDLRVSQRIASPVTVASSVLLPANYSTWDKPTLTMVLAHERAHVRQGDFYVQLLAGVHCAVFWFNPFSWWLQRQLSDLGEALSDRAAVEYAESRASYAEILLAFATRARWPLAGVGMASASNLTSRIERLLNDRGFERCFDDKRRSPVVAAAVVLLAMAASTATMRVSAETSSAPGPTAPASVKSGGVPTRDLDADTDEVSNANGDIDVHGRAVDIHEGVLAIRAGKSRVTINAGNPLPAPAGDYIYFQHQGKPYLIQDPKIISQAQALLAPIDDLDRQQRELGKQQALLGAQERALAAQQRAVKVDSPDFKREILEIETVAKKMNLAQAGAQIDQKALAELQSHLAEIQSRVADLQTDLGRKEGSFGEKQGELGEQQGKLGEQQALLAEQSRKIVEQVRRQMRPILEQAIREGKGQALVNW